MWLKLFSWLVWKSKYLCCKKVKQFYWSHFQFHNFTKLHFILHIFSFYSFIRCYTKMILLKYICLIKILDSRTRFYYHCHIIDQKCQWTNKCIYLFGVGQECSGKLHTKQFQSGCVLDTAHACCQGEARQNRMGTRHQTLTRHICINYFLV